MSSASPQDTSSSTPSALPQDTSSSPAVTSPAPATAQPAIVNGDPVAGKKLYAMNCAMCHGVKGGGNGPAAAAIKPRPTNFTDPNLKNKLFTDTDDPDREWLKVTKEGGAANKLGAAMPGFGSSLTDKQIQDIIAFIHSVQKKK
jgi:mono/diheme cytochrome c family protein